MLLSGTTAASVEPFRRVMSLSIFLLRSRRSWSRRTPAAVKIAGRELLSSEPEAACMLLDLSNARHCAGLSVDVVHTCDCDHYCYTYNEQRRTIMSRYSPSLVPSQSMEINPGHHPSRCSTPRQPKNGPFDIEGTG